MQRAIVLAKQASPEDTAPNPRVGALITLDGKIIAEGFHAADGGPHAERVAIDRLDLPLQAPATLYVTLEPCSSEGRTGACCKHIIENGSISRVVIGAIDPNPAHRGSGIKILEDAGIQVAHGVLATECEALNPDFNQRMQSR